MTVSAGEQVVKLVKGSNTVFIQSAKVDEILVNKVIKVQRPIVPANQDTKNPGTISVDLNRIEHVFNIQGFLSADTGSGNEALLTAKAVKDELITNIIYKKGDIQLHYRDYADSDYGEYYGDGSSGAEGTYIRTQLDKVQFTDASLRADESSTAVTRYAIQINLTRGKIK